MLAFVEPCLGIICACLPVMRPFFKWAFGGMFRIRFTGNKFIDESTQPASGASRLSSNGYARQSSYNSRDHAEQDVEMVGVNGHAPTGGAG